MLASISTGWLRCIGEVVGGILLYLAQSPRQRTSRQEAVAIPVLSLSPTQGTTPLTTKGIQNVMASFSIADLSKLLTLAPLVVAGVEQLHSESSSTTKHQVAKDALTLATGVADAVDSGDSTTTDSVSSNVSAIIDSVVSILNAAKMFTHKATTAQAVTS
jgi:hypothetical protein